MPKDSWRKEHERDATKRSTGPDSYATCVFSKTENSNESKIRFVEHILIRLQSETNSIRQIAYRDIEKLSPRYRVALPLLKSHLYGNSIFRGGVERAIELVAASPQPIVTQRQAVRSPMSRAELANFLEDMGLTIEDLL